MKKLRLIVIGHGMVGHHFIETLVAKGGLDEYEIVVIGKEPVVAYDRVKLSSVFSTNTPDDLQLTSEKWYTDKGIELILGQSVTHIDRVRQCVSFGANQREYDTLIFATGSTPFIPPIMGADRDQCFVYRTLADLDAIRVACASAKTGAVIGGGLLGLEAANALRLLGIKTHVIEFAPRLMPVQLDAFGGAVLAQKITELGVTIHTDCCTEKITDGEFGRHRLWFNDAEPLDVDVVVFSAGIRPQDALARDCGLPIGERGGIIINDYCQTEDEGIFAIGECALWQSKIFGLVAPGYQMAKTVATYLMGENTLPFQGADMSTKLKLLGVDVASIGDAQMQMPDAQEVILQDCASGVYKKLVVNAKGDRLLGAILVGDNQDYADFLTCYLDNIPLPTHAAALLLDTSILSGTASDQSLVCSCHNVTRGELIHEINQGHQTVSALKTATNAGTGCGGCVNNMKTLLEAQLLAMGKAVNDHLCEHFPHSRQTLYHLCQVEEIKTFDDLRMRYGQGLGCDVCKPTVASILASLWNAPVLSSAHQPLQDSNDAFLANIQKDGSYSVVPRIAGGEITPDKLIALGNIAKQFDLYTKITGGQRVDLFGAQLSQLPDIWQALIAAGFETGHAYGKSLRTVKSCVGNTWCRYGVQDSVSLAIQLENRYKGLRSPHKLKFAVSGCTRECAEAQSKDIGIIATEHGWNLYVGGNGGMTPRHGTLFATGLTTATLVTYIDRILMFYVKTADRLQRTSVWFEQLEGGLPYLQNVIIDDSLELCAALEAQMRHVIETYECEWKNTLSSDEKLRRFRQFVNAQNLSVVGDYQRLRGQRIPVKAIL